MDIEAATAALNAANAGLSAFKGAAEAMKAIGAAVRSMSGVDKGLIERLAVAEGHARTAYREFMKLMEHHQTLRNSYEALLSQQKAAQERIAVLEKFDAEQADYQLTAHLDHTVSRVYAPGGKPVEPVQHLCPACFEAKKRAHLQFVNNEFHVTNYKCPACGYVTRMANSIKPTFMAAPLLPRDIY